MSDDSTRNEDEQAGDDDVVRASVDAEVVSSPRGEADDASGEEPATGTATQRGKDIPSDMRQWAMFCHLGGLAGWVVPWVGGIVATLILWQVKREEHAFVDDQGREAVNFNITVAIAEAVCIPLFCIYVGALLYLAVAIGAAILAILAAIQASEGKPYRYPFTIRFVK